MVHPLREPLPGLSVDDAQPPPMDHSIGGPKPCQYSHAMAWIILARVERGESVQQIAADPRMPSYRTIYDWLEWSPDFAQAWDEMRAEQAAARRKALLAPRPAPPGRKRGRKSTYTPKVADAWCELIEAGYTLREAAAVPGMPAVAMVHRWVRNHPEFRRAYEAALHVREMFLEEEAFEFARYANPFELASAKAAVRRIEGRIGALRPDVWRWWD